MSLKKKIGPLSRKETAHLLRRATFGPNITQIRDNEGKTVDQILDLLFDPNGFGLNYLPFDPQDGKVWVEDNHTRADYLMVSYFQFYVYLNHLENFHIKEKLQEFLYMFAACGVRDRKPQLGFHLYNHCQYHVKTNLKEFLRGLLFNSLYLATLNNDQNTKDSPIEDVGREFLEMASLGKGPEVAFGDYTTYTEHDVRQVSRIMTGLRPAYVFDGTLGFTDPNTGIPRGVVTPAWHDTGDKQFSNRMTNYKIIGRSGISGVEQEVNEFIDHVIFGGASMLHLAENYATRLYRYFVNDKVDSQVLNDIISPLMNELILNGFDLLAVTRILLESEHFFAEKNIGSKVKSGMDFLSSVQNQFEVSMPNRFSDPTKFWHDLGRDSIVRYLLENMDHEPMSPPTIAGYAGDWVEDRWSEAWISHNNLGFRQLVADMVTQDSKILINWAQIHMHWGTWAVLNLLKNPNDASSVLIDLVSYVLPQDISDTRRDHFLNNVLLEGNNASYWSGLTNNEKIVQLEKLFRSLVQSPEFQLY